MESALATERKGSTAQTKKPSVTFITDSNRKTVSRPLRESLENYNLNEVTDVYTTSDLLYKLNVLTINTRGIQIKTTSITAALHTNNTHISAITETLLTGNEDVNITGYQSLGQNRPHKGGGVGFFIRNDISKIAIGIVYGKQETASKEKVEFQERTTVINRIKK